MRGNRPSRAHRTRLVRGNSTFGRKVLDGKRDPTPQEGPNKCWDGGDFGQDHGIGPGADPKEIGKIMESIQRTRHRQKINNVMSARKRLPVEKGERSRGGIVLGYNLKPG